jgi:hypothetical protein
MLSAINRNTCPQSPESAGREHAVKTDDPRLDLKKLFERIQKINDLMLTVLKSHLILEQFINEFLDASGGKYDELTFAEKAKLCETLNPAEIDQPIWIVVTAANKLRNKIAHTLDQTQIQSKMDELRTAYLAALTPAQVKEAEKLDNVRTAHSACALCGAYLVVATQAREKANSLVQKT